MSLQDLENRLLKQVEFDPNSGCWLWSGAVARGGYGHFGYDGKTLAAHRAAWRVWKGEIPVGDSYQGMCVCHRCDTPQCVNPDHLFFGTKKQNMEDASAKQRIVSGENHGWSKLTNADVLRIRAMARDGHVQYNIASLFGIAQQTVSKIAARKRWEHLP